MTVIIPKAAASKGVFSAVLLPFTGANNPPILMGDILVPGERRARLFKIAAHLAESTTMWGAAGARHGDDPPKPGRLPMKDVGVFQRALAENRRPDTMPSEQHLFLAVLPHASLCSDPIVSGWYNPGDKPVMRLWGWTGYTSKGYPMMIGIVQQQNQHRRHEPPLAPTEHFPDFRYIEPRSASPRKEMAR